MADAEALVPEVFVFIVLPVVIVCVGPIILVACAFHTKKSENQKSSANQNTNQAPSNYDKKFDAVVRSKPDIASPTIVYHPEKRYANHAPQDFDDKYHIDAVIVSKPERASPTQGPSYPGLPISPPKEDPCHKNEIK